MMATTASSAGNGTGGWAERHPAKAAEEQAFRRERRTIRKDWSHKVNGTPETHFRASQVRQGALARLYESGAIDIEQLSASQEIAAVHRRIGAEVTVRTVSLETRVDASRTADGTFFERLGAVRAEVAYTRWRAALPGPAAPILDMIAGDLGYSRAARIYCMDQRRAKRLLIQSLDLWQAMARAARDEVDEATLAAAQAAIL
jgi:hypothetical protein